MSVRCPGCNREMTETEIRYTEGGVLDYVHGFWCCGECYAKRYPRCGCGVFLQAGWKFCPQCGMKLGGQG